MRKYENHCVGCPEGMGCLGKSCPYMHVPVDYCDECGNDNAQYRIDGSDYCEECANDYLQQSFDDLSIDEKAEILNIDYERIRD